MEAPEDIPPLEGAEDSLIEADTDEFEDCQSDEESMQMVKMESFKQTEMNLSNVKEMMMEVEEFGKEPTTGPISALSEPEVEKMLLKERNPFTDDNTE